MTDRRRRADAASLAAVSIAFVALIVAAGGVLLGLETIREIDRNEKRDTAAIRAAAWRICERDQRERAFAHSFFAITGDTAPRRLFLERFLPIVDCAPNLTGKSAVALSIDAQRAYVRRFMAGELVALPEITEPG